MAEARQYPRPATKANARFEVKASADGSETAIYIYDEIGFWGVTAANFQRALSAIDTDTIRLHINSPGGDVFDGLAIFNLLVDHPAHISVSIDGLAASAASLIAMAGDDIAIADNAFLMIHNAWTIALGNADDMAHVAKVLGKVDSALASTYAQRTGLSLTDIKSMMSDETWLDAGDAVEHGFADRVKSDDSDAKARAAFDTSVFRNAPLAVKGLGTSAPLRERPATDNQHARLSQALKALTATLRS